MDFCIRVRPKKPFYLRPYGKLVLTNLIFLSGNGGTVMCAVDNLHFELAHVTIKKTRYSLETVIAKAGKVQFYVNGEDAVVKLYGVLYPFGTNEQYSTNIQYQLDRWESYLNTSNEDDSDEDDDD